MFFGSYFQLSPLSTQKKRGISAQSGLGHYSNNNHATNFKYFEINFAEIYLIHHNNSVICNLI